MSFVVYSGYALMIPGGKNRRAETFYENPNFSYSLEHGRCNARCSSGALDSDITKETGPYELLLGFTIFLDARRFQAFGGLVWVWQSLC
jgi:hypothetical protein